MDISVSQAQGSVPVTVLKLDGQLDGQTYQDLIGKAQDLYNSGSRDFLLDLSDLTYISSAGLVALHSVALLTRGQVLISRCGYPIALWGAPPRQAFNVKLPTRALK
jgi:anti-anti-sigma factor